jgi:phenylpropionate dioxygenase-like ring-hydroxylating dioxygenase large terminal subunit
MRECRSDLPNELALSDGTRLSDLINRDRREVSLRVHRDREIFAIELEKIFTRSWIPVAHESEIPAQGDYVRRYIGQDSCLVVRAEDNAVNVLLNVCTHRGMALCREEQGRAQAFKCPYHGWVFDRAGNFRGAPFEAEMYGRTLREHPDEFALTTAKTANLGGFVFANWDPHAEPFDDYLGDAKWYLEAMIGRTDRGLEVIGPPQRHIVKGNWKLLAEQTTDGYHSTTLHRSMEELGVFEHKVSSGINVATQGGHTMRLVDFKATWNLAAGSDSATLAQRLADMPPPGTDARMTEQFSNQLSQGQLKLLAETPPATMGLFPGMTLLSFLSHDGTAQGGLGPVVVAHTWIPKSPEMFEMLSWVLVERDASPELRELTRRTTIRNFGISGVIEQDDAEAWRGVQRSSTGVMGRRITAKYDARLGLNRPDGFEGRGEVFAGTSRDDAQWAWWDRYYTVMER